MLVAALVGAVAGIGAVVFLKLIDFVEWLIIDQIFDGLFANFPWWFILFAPALGGRVAVQPVTIHYRPAPHLPREFYAWWGEMDFATHLRDVLARSVGGSVELVFHAPLEVARAAGRKDLAEAAGRAVRGELERLRG